MGGFDACQTGHRGTLLDLGDPSTGARYGRLRPPDVDAVEHGGATWARVRAKTVTLTFLSPEGEADPSTAVAVRVKSTAARSMSIHVNGKAIGSSSLAKGETKVVTAHTPFPMILAGTNEVQLLVIARALGVA